MSSISNAEVPGKKKKKIKSRDQSLHRQEPHIEFWPTLLLCQKEIEPFLYFSGN